MDYMPLLNIYFTGDSTIHIKPEKKKNKKSYISKSKPVKRIRKPTKRKKMARKSRKYKKRKSIPQTDPINWDLPEIDFE